MLDTFFAGSEEELVMTLVNSRRLPAERLARLRKVIDDAEALGAPEPEDGE